MQTYEKEQEKNLEDIIEDDDDELDLIALVGSNANDTNQYLLFEGSDGQYYAQNVSKIEELIVYKDIDIAKTHGNELVVGTADIRGNMTTIIKFDKWFGNAVLDDDAYELVILTQYNKYRVGIVVKRVESIVNIPNENMHNSADNDEKTSFVTRVHIGRENKICIVYDSDRMFLDVFNTIDTKAQKETQSAQKVTSDKTLFFADDSRVVRKMAESIFTKMGLNYKIYENGKELLNAIEMADANEIALVITDMEMPVLGGYDVIKTLRSQNKYDKVNILVHTNMSNPNMESSLLEIGAQAIINKINMQAFSEAISKYIK